MTAPEVSVVLPMHNAGPFIESALRSVLDQHVDLEVVVVDDASTDDGPARVRGFADSRVQLLSLPRVGVIGARNAGLARARAPFLASMDADDLSLPGRFAAQLALLRSDPTIALCGCVYEAVDATGGRLSVIAPPTDDADLRRRMHVQTPFAGGSLLFRREALKEAGPYSSDATAAEDYDLIRRLGRVGRLGSVPGLHYSWRVHHTNTSSGVRTAERETAGRIRDQVWREEELERLSSRELARRARRYHAAGPFGPLVAQQLVRTELLLAAALLRRGRRRHAAAALGAVLALPPAVSLPVYADVPARLREVRRHRRR